ncbi:MAG: YIP1 family protein [Oscillospiraceae bacterium]
MKKTLAGIKYSLYVLSHPIDGFYRIRFENAGNLISCFVLLVALVASFICKESYTGFIFTETDPRDFNVLWTIANVLVPVVLWCVANWSITVLMDGCGRFIDIFMATVYATVPLTATTFLNVILSRWLAQDEQTFLSIIMYIGVFLTGLLLFMGMLTIHQFTVLRTVFALILTLIGMVFIVFLALLFASVMDQLIGYITSVITEIKLRM